MIPKAQVDRAQHVRQPVDIGSAQENWAASLMRQPSLICCLLLFSTLFDCLGHFCNRHERASNLVKKHVSVLFLRERLGK